MHIADRIAGFEDDAERRHLLLTRSPLVCRNGRIQITGQIADQDAEHDGQPGCKHLFQQQHAGQLLARKPHGAKMPNCTTRLDRLKNQYNK